MLSGGLASGKSLVRELLASAGILTIDADGIGHQVLEPEGPAFSSVVARWPQVVKEGEVDRSALAAVVFDKPKELTVLESITHPHIFDMIKVRVEEVDGPVVVEVPVLSHGLGDEWRRIVVDCRDETRLARAVERGMTEGDAKSRMSVQPSRAEWLAAADVVVPNHSDREDASSTVERLLPML